MAQLKTSIWRTSSKLHSWLGWTGGIALFIFAISGFLHILMTWTGPRAVSFFPPQVSVKAGDVAKIPEILAQQNIEKAIMAKIIPSKEGPLLQVTQSNTEPRRYFDLKTGLEKPGYDKDHAIWLARYYSGFKDAPVKVVHFQTEFTSAYPWVNRLLPVYRVEFETSDNRELYIYTELGALAGMTNGWKTSIQSVFRVLHTWSWLDDFEYARIFLMMLLLLSLFGMAVTGIALIFLIKKRPIPDGPRKWHRYFSFAVWIPLLCFSASGIYHLLQYSFGDNHRGIQAGKPINLDASRLGVETSWLEQFKDQAFNNLSIVEGRESQNASAKIYYRLSVPGGKAGQAVSRSKRFKGMATEKRGLYFDALTGEKASLTDKDMAIYIADKHLGFSKELLVNSALITNFGPHYDFRNKRLPVWQLDYATGAGDKLFIDPATGMLVDRLVNLERYEGYSFSFLHKWNFLVPLIGREKRDIVIFIILFTAVLFGAIGYLMLFKRRSRR